MSKNLLLSNTGARRPLHVMFTYCMPVMNRSCEGASELTFSPYSRYSGTVRSYYTSQVTKRNSS